MNIPPSVKMTEGGSLYPKSVQKVKERGICAVPTINLRQSESKWLASVYVNVPPFCLTVNNTVKWKRSISESAFYINSIRFFRVKSHFLRTPIWNYRYHSFTYCTLSSYYRQLLHNYLRRSHKWKCLCKHSEKIMKSIQSDHPSTILIFKVK